MNLRAAMLLPQPLHQNEGLVTQIHEPSSDSICYDWPLTILFEK